MIPRKDMLLLLGSLLMLAGFSGLPASDEIPGAPQDHPIALVGGTVHTVSGGTLKGGAVLFDKGRIIAVGGEGFPEGTEQVDARGKHIYPGLFDAYTNLGLVEINSIRATRDESETGNLNPNVRAEIAVNPDSELIPVARSNGVLLALTAPTGGLLSGKSAVLQLDGWTWEDLTVKSGAGMHISWPSMSPVSDWWIEKSAKDQLQDRDKQLKLLEETFKQARLSMQAQQGEEKGSGDLRLEAMIPVLQGKQPIIVSANSISQIQSAVAFAVRQKVRLVIFGGYDAPACSALLKQHDVPVIVGSVYRLPRRRGDDYDAAFTLPARLHQAGVSFCIASNGRFGASNVRNLPYHAATAVAYGLPAEEALRAITLYPARILGVDDQVGSITTGHDATLIVTSGDPLETTTRIEHAFIQGRQVDLSNKHTRLWQKYRAKYQQQRDAAGQ